MNKKTNTKSAPAASTAGKKYHPSVGFFPAKSGNGFTISINAKVLETLQTAQPGGRLLLQEISEEQRGDRENFPHYRVTIFPPNDQKADSSDGI